MSPVCSAHVSYDKRHVNTSVPIAFCAIHSIYITTECQKTYSTALYLILIRTKFVCRQRHHGRTQRLRCKQATAAVGARRRTRIAADSPIRRQTGRWQVLVMLPP